MISHTPAIRTIRRVAAARALWGAVLTVATPALLRRLVPEENASGSFVLFARTVGIRNCAFGFGCLLATRGQETAELRRWVLAWLLSDLADVVAGAAAHHRIGPKSAGIAALAPVPFVLSGINSLARLIRQPVERTRMEPRWA